MSELRKDPIIDRWVIVAAERGARPSDFKEERKEVETKSCPFCGGNEHMTPPEVFALRDGPQNANGPDWHVRVVPNKFPALSIHGSQERSGLGLLDRMDGIGAHEVIIETPEHSVHLSDAPVSQIARVLWTYKSRLVDLRGDRRFRHMIVFRNYGSIAGASLAHPHSQLIALPITPKAVKDRLRAAQAHYRAKERCIWCDLIRQEAALPERMVQRSEHYIALAPYAARFPFEVHLFPTRHCHDFVLMSDDETWELAQFLKEILLRIKVTLNDPAYNMMLQTAPNPLPRPGRPDYWGTIEYDYHWHIEIVPRLTKVAGFEWGTGFYINPVAPEQSARFLAEAEVPIIAEAVAV